jgi:KaiC/GvpD/RAD55 family RecA-like ATPase
MNKKKINLFQERQIIINMIVNDKFLRELYPITKSKYFKSSYGRIVSRWVLEYYKEHKQAPQKQIQELFYQKSQHIHDEDDIEDISNFLQSLSDEWEKISEQKNIDFSITNAVQYLKIRSLEMVRDNIDRSILEGNSLKGEQAIAEYNRVEKASGVGVSLLKDSTDITIAFMEEDERLFQFPGVLGEVCGTFVRGDFVSFLGAAKKGKTFFLLYTGETAVFYGYKVVLFELEMTKNQVLRRGWQSLVGRPRKDSDIIIPKFVECGDDDKYLYEVELVEKKKKSVDISNIKNDQKKFKRIFRSGDFKIVQLPAYSIDPEGLEAHLDNFYYYENFVPDVIIIDSADLLLSSGYKDYRHQLDIIWKKLRRMAQDRNSLVVTASHTGRTAFNKDAKEENIAEDIRKINHVSKMIAINKDKEDAKINAVRIEQLAERDGKRNYRQALVLQCLEIGKPYIDSRYANEVKRD